MNPHNNQKYMRKLIKIVQDKQNQIQILKKQLRKEKVKVIATSNNILDQQITNQLGMASYQLKEVAEQILSMERKMMEMQQGWKEETLKNDRYELEINDLKVQNAQLKSTTLNSHQQHQSQLSVLLLQYQQSISILQSKQEQIAQQLQETKQKCKNSQLINNKHEQQIQTFKQQILAKEKQVLRLQKQAKEKQDFYKNQIQIFNSSLKLQELEMEEKAKQIQDKLNLHSHLKQKLKNCQQFSYEICQYIESIFLKYCCPSNLRSSKKLINNDNKFQNTIKKIMQIQHFLQDLHQKYQKIRQGQELPNQTLQNLSVIVQSIQQKLQLCDLTQMMKKEQQENQQQLLKNLEMECENDDHNRSKIVQLGEIKQVLKMTKEVNRQLMDQICQKQYIINQCKKHYEKLLKNGAGGIDSSKIKTLLHLKI